MQQTPNIFLIVLDTIRVDQLRLQPKPQAPRNFIEQKLVEGCLFDNIVVSGNSTRISMNGFFHGFFGETSGLNYHYQTESSFENSRVLSLADILHYYGYYTIGMSQGDQYIPTHGFDEFHYFTDDLPPESKFRTVDQPIFTYLHFLGLHDQAFGSPEDMTPTGYRHHFDLMADEVQKFWEQWITEDDLVIIVSDHGCQLRDHADDNWRFYMDEEPTGGIFLDECCVQGVASILYKDLFPSKAVSSLVRGIDFLPTLMDALGGEIPPVQGVSLWDSLQDGAEWPALPGFSEAGGIQMEDGKAVSRSIRQDTWKYCHYETKGEFLFDLTSPEGELHNLILQDKDKTLQARDVLERQSLENQQGYLHWYQHKQALYDGMLNHRPSQQLRSRGGRTSCFRNMIDADVKQHLHAVLHNNANRWRANNERIAIYSLSEHAATFLDGGALTHLAPFVGMIDSNPRLSRDTFCGLPVYTVAEAEAVLQPTMIIVAHYFFANDIYVTIKNHFVKPVPVFNAYRISEEVNLWWNRKEICP